ncbi:hypothetical protein Q4595_01900 [Wenyingzhuangia sp. 1_MG-2023]|nr:hypothetical protein [Wenyingzhuangia sp. 1_MG-2023]
MVLGHSLETIDKTLLEHIFNHNKCNNIMLHKRQFTEEKDAKIEFNKLLYGMSRTI